MFVPRVSLPEHMPTLEGQWFVFDDRQNVLLIDGEVPVGLEPPMAVPQPHLLGLDDGRPIRTGLARVDDDGGMELPDGATWISMREAYGALSNIDWAMAGRGAQVLVWDRDHQFCSRCGTATDPHPIDRSRVCPSCRLMAFPRLSPAVIMLVERDGEDGPEVLLAWGRQFPGRFFSALAGFVEPGESLEECVVREVREETGIEVDDVRYFGSQPWPFPHSLMIGFNARYVSGEITIQEEEIVEAGWYPADALPPVPRGGMSIAGWLIEDWLRRVGDGSL